MGVILSGIFWPWHLAMCFPGIQRSMYGSYGRYVFCVVMECLALVAYLALGAVSTCLSLIRIPMPTSMALQAIAEYWTKLRYTHGNS